MIIAMKIMLLCIRFSLLMTTNAAFFHSHHMKAFHELDYEPVSSTMFSRKLLLKKMVKEYEDQDLVLYNNQKAALLGGTQVRRNEVVFGEKGSDPTQFTNMDYSSVRRRRPIHNNSSKTTNSP
uniref:uncharacterized protein LOC122597931 n=1 Tax=Erigeron canadensis TaxID=72917 RepID=UPI001CB91834|nr:uncharacterized protein LOC122597931 [Erigeron canadensis]